MMSFCIYKWWFLYANWSPQQFEMLQLAIKDAKDDGGGGGGSAARVFDIDMTVELAQVAICI